MNIGMWNSEDIPHEWGYADHLHAAGLRVLAGANDRMRGASQEWTAGYNNTSVL